MSFILSTKRNRKHKALTPRLGDKPMLPGTRKVEIGWLLGWKRQATLFLVRFYFGEGEGRLFGCFTATEKQTRSRDNLTLPQILAKNKRQASLPVIDIVNLVPTLTSPLD